MSIAQGRVPPKANRSPAPNWTNCWPWPRAASASCWKSSRNTLNC